MDMDKLRLWALLRISRGDTTDNPEMDAAGYGVVSGPDRDVEAIAEAAIRGDEAAVTAALPSGITREMIEAAR